MKQAVSAASYLVFQINRDWSYALFYVRLATAVMLGVWSYILLRTLLPAVEVKEVLGLVAIILLYILIWWRTKKAEPHHVRDMGRRAAIGWAATWAILPASLAVYMAFFALANPLP